MKRPTHLRLPRSGPVAVDGELVELGAGLETRAPTLQVRS